MKTKYQMMKESEIYDGEGNLYPDLATFPIDNFVSVTKPINYQLTQLNCKRFFDLIKDFYSTYDFYDDVILWLNDIDYISDETENFEKVIKMYSKTDIDNWYITGVKGESVEQEKRIQV